ncbi:hypothetical protein Phi46:1_gp49 [Cellulophaga phage phi46:1]|uniref:hypothetical protein n=1 Tax=Cellulophaga phage phi46:1 TaxID=1327974 RepID=UPI00035180EA|nr:hypothetical protein Phi46:1_gp49 [Cellulophaga phage phi46:1]AGO47860.1 hypothetical protein Phi46:1_gp49 [Cellulophaga phage phi46:1]
MNLARAPSMENPRPRIFAFSFFLLRKSYTNYLKMFYLLVSEHLPVPIDFKVLIFIIMFKNIVRNRKRNIIFVKKNSNLKNAKPCSTKHN